MSTSSCGTSPGVAATGTPIALGAIVTNQPGTSFTDIPNMAAAYFACVNANGGINGHPIKLYIETEQTNPAQIAADAKQLVQTDHVVGIVGNTSIIECSVDSSYWQKLGFYIIDSGIAPECYGTPNSAAVNMGPRYSSDGAVQYALSQHVSKIVFDQSNVPGTGYIAAGPIGAGRRRWRADRPADRERADLRRRLGGDQGSRRRRAERRRGAQLHPARGAGHPAGGAEARPGGPRQAVGLLDAVQHRLPGHRRWDPKWNNKLFVNAELLPPDVTNTPTMNLYKAILKQYGTAVSGGIGSFSQMGFTEAEIAVHALESITSGTYTVASVNAAFKAVTNFNTGMLCQLWTYGSYPMHIPNNEDSTVTPDNGKMVTAQGCTLISAVDPQIAQYRSAAGTAALEPTS